ncbi:ribosomal RNA methyltransferase MRM2, variant [Magnaporthiopsis poae ATCC 64411]|uniref:rRNA methyltransferase 2, mitochondrial n=1 Tax=Magnaporthiopsis poae (strain ATCC 64411 / 73-15) TaxID=644358 RepID=A0A0C4DS45_MAGP6|nr:ribosomal RNA methyltransferase MRM2, variant [Magnaporthiopsis poae ATCC 64411]
MLNLGGSTRPILLGASGGFRRTLSFQRHIPTAAAVSVGSTVRSLLPIDTHRGGPWTQQQRTSRSSSSSYWKERQENDQYVREARVNKLKSRAAFKLFEMDYKYKLFKKGALVIDLGYAPGSWSQVAIERTKPTGRVLGIDLIPAQPPRGMGAIQGNFLSPTVRKMAKQLIVELHRRQLEDEAALRAEEGRDVVTVRPSYIDMEHRASRLEEEVEEEDEAATEAVVVADDAEPPSSSPPTTSSERSPEGAEGPATIIKPEDKKYVDIVLSDMSEPWPQTSGFRVNTLSNPYHRLMNTSGISFRDHAGSMPWSLPTKP